MELMGLTATEIGLRLALGLATGFCIGLTGVGGAILVYPVLTLLLKVDTITAVGTTTLYAFLSRITAIIHHIKLKTVDWSTGLRFLAGAVPANIAAAWWISRQGNDAAFASGLRVFIVYMVLGAALFTLFNTLTKSLPSVIRKERSMAHRMNATPARRTLFSILLGALCGGLIGATSIGNGVLVVPVLMIFFGLTASRTVGTAIFITFILTLATALIYGCSGEQDHSTAVIMTIGSLGGVYCGSKWSVKLPEPLLRTIVISMIMLIAGMMLLSLNRY